MPEDPTGPLLTPADRALLDSARRAVLVTIAPDGVPRPVPVCFVALGDPVRLFVPLDDKPKRAADPRRLARVRDIEARPQVALLVDRWDEDWTRLAWLRIEATATLVEPGGPAGGATPADPGHAAVVAALRARYPQYAAHRLEGAPLIAIDPRRVVRWSASG